MLHSDEGDLPIEINGCNVDGSVGSSDGVAGRDLKPSPSDLRRPMGSRVVSRVDDGKVTKNKGTNWVCSFHLLLSPSLSLSLFFRSSCPSIPCIDLGPDAS